MAEPLAGAIAPRGAPVEITLRDVFPDGGPRPVRLHRDAVVIGEERVQKEDSDLRFAPAVEQAETPIPHCAVAVEAAKELGTRRPAMCPQLGGRRIAIGALVLADAEIEGGAAEVNGESAVEEVDALRRPRTAKLVGGPFGQRAEDDRSLLPLKDAYYSS